MNYDCTDQPTLRPDRPLVWSVEYFPPLSSHCSVTNFGNLKLEGGYDDTLRKYLLKKKPTDNKLSSRPLSLEKLSIWLRDRLRNKWYTFDGYTGKIPGSSTYIFTVIVYGLRQRRVACLAFEELRRKISITCWWNPSVWAGLDEVCWWKLEARFVRNGRGHI